MIYPVVQIWRKMLNSLFLYQIHCYFSSEGQRDKSSFVPVQGQRDKGLIYRNCLSLKKNDGGKCNLSLRGTKGQCSPLWSLW